MALPSPWRLANRAASSPQLPPLHIDGDEIRKRENPTVPLKRHLHAAFRRIQDAIRYPVLEDDVGRPGSGAGRHGRVVVPPEETRVLVEPESLDAAVDRQGCSKVGLQQAVPEVGPFDVRSLPPGRGSVITPE